MQTDAEVLFEYEKAFELLFEIKKYQLIFLVKKKIKKFPLYGKL
jgi:hypothetical protein